MKMDVSLIKYNHVDVRQQELCVLSDVNLDLHPGELVYLIGKVGSGKTSLLKTFYGELDVDSGKAEVLGYDMCRIKRRRLPELRRQLGIIFQDFQLLTDRTAYQNLEFLVGMERKGYKFPNELSGGEQQRIAIARAVLNSPKVILADEPTGNLDVETGHAIAALLEDLSRKGALVIVTTHNLRLLEEFPGRVYRCADHRLAEITNVQND